MDTLTYEAFLDEVTTLLTEMYDMEDEAAIKLVMQAQDAEYFVAHDDKPELRTLEQAKIEAVALYQTKQNKVQTQQKQQKRVAVKKRP
jgi:GTP-binding protein EngB required for normal cell division